MSEAEPPADAGVETVAVHAPRSGAVPVVFDSPHSGSLYPEDFRAAVPLAMLQGGEDRFVDDLFADAPDRGATLVRALFPRTYVDPNRAETDIDPELLEGGWDGPVEPGGHSARGVGLVFRLIGDGMPIYGRRLAADEIRSRIERCWRPYHRRLDDTIDALHARHGAIWHVNCHSMQAVGNVLSPDPGRVRPDFVLGDLDGASCEPAFTRFVAGALADLGYSVGLNDPYRGAFIVERHGRPREGRHSIQIEINRDLYMDPDTLEKHDGFETLRVDMKRFSEKLALFAGERLRPHS